LTHSAFQIESNKNNWNREEKDGSVILTITYQGREWTREKTWDKERGGLKHLQTIGQIKRNCDADIDCLKTSLTFTSLTGSVTCCRRKKRKKKTLEEGKGRRLEAVRRNPC